jgi:hypothetical protein
MATRTRAACPVPFVPSCSVVARYGVIDEIAICAFFSLPVICDSADTSRHLC